MKYCFLFLLITNGVLAQIEPTFFPEGYEDNARFQDVFPLADGKIYYWIKSDELGDLILRGNRTDEMDEIIFPNIDFEEGEIDIRDIFEIDEHIYCLFQRDTSLLYSAEITNDFAGLEILDSLELSVSTFPPLYRKLFVGTPWTYNKYLGTWVNFVNEGFSEKSIAGRFYLSLNPDGTIDQFEIVDPKLEGCRKVYDYKWIEKSLKYKVIGPKSSNFDPFTFEGSRSRVRLFAPNFLRENGGGTYWYNNTEPNYFFENDSTAIIVDHFKLIGYDLRLCFLMKAELSENTFNSVGETVTSYIPLPNSINEKEAIMDNHGDIIVASTTKRFEDPDAKEELYIIKYNNDLEELWRRRFTFEDYIFDNLRGVYIDNDNNILTYGTLKIGGDFFSERAFTLFLDSNGSVHVNTSEIDHEDNVRITNPVEDQLSIHGIEDIENYSGIIYDLRGNVISVMDQLKSSISDLAQYKSGTYVLRIKHKNTGNSRSLLFVKT